MRHLQSGAFALGMLLSASAMADADLHFVGTAGLSFGGDKLATVQYTNGNSSDVTAGGTVYIAAGGALDFKDTPLSLRVMGGYHVDKAAAQNGDVTFDRTTLDAQAFYRIGNHRIGGGLVQHYSPKYQDDFDGISAEFKDATGTSIEYNYLPEGSKVGFSLRAVFIDYELKTVNNAPAKHTFSGNYVGAGVLLYI